MLLDDSSLMILASERGVKEELYLLVLDSTARIGKELLFGGRVVAAELTD